MELNLHQRRSSARARARAPWLLFGFQTSVLVVHSRVGAMKKPGGKTVNWKYSIYRIALSQENVPSSSLFWLVLWFCPLALPSCDATSASRSHP